MKREEPREEYENEPRVHCIKGLQRRQHGEQEDTKSALEVDAAIVKLQRVIERVIVRRAVISYIGLKLGDTFREECRTASFGGGITKAPTCPGKKDEEGE